MTNSISFNVPLMHRLIAVLDHEVFRDGLRHENICLNDGSAITKTLTMLFSHFYSYLDNFKHVEQLMLCMEELRRYQDEKAIVVNDWSLFIDDMQNVLSTSTLSEEAKGAWVSSTHPICLKYAKEHEFQTAYADPFATQEQKPSVIADVQTLFYRLFLNTYPEFDINLHTNGKGINFVMLMNYSFTISTDFIGELVDRGADLMQKSNENGYAFQCLDFENVAFFYADEHELMERLIYFDQLGLNLNLQERYVPYKNNTKVLLGEEEVQPVNSMLDRMQALIDDEEYEFNQYILPCRDFLLRHKANHEAMQAAQITDAVSTQRTKMKSGI